jgi:hypothetical protein
MSPAMEAKIDAASVLPCHMTGDMFPHELIYPTGLETMCKHCHQTVTRIVERAS